MIAAINDINSRKAIRPFTYNRPFSFQSPFDMEKAWPHNGSKKISSKIECIIQ
jgi:hypothetical protein